MLNPNVNHVLYLKGGICDFDEGFQRGVLKWLLPKTGKAGLTHEALGIGTRGGEELGGHRTKRAVEGIVLYAPECDALVLEAQALLNSQAHVISLVRERGVTLPCLRLEIDTERRAVEVPEEVLLSAGPIQLPEEWFTPEEEQQSAGWNASALSIIEQALGDASSSESRTPASYVGSELCKVSQYGITPKDNLVLFEGLVNNLARLTLREFGANYRFDHERLLLEKTVLDFPRFLLPERYVPRLHKSLQYETLRKAGVRIQKGEPGFLLPDCLLACCIILDDIRKEIADINEMLKKQD